MKLCPECHMTVEQGEICPYCKATLSQKDEKAFEKDYYTDLIKTVWFSLFSLLAGVVSLLVFGEALGGAGVHTVSFAVISSVLALVQFKSFGKYSRRFHTSSFWKIAVISVKYACAAIALMIAVVPLLMMLG